MKKLIALFLAALLALSLATSALADTHTDKETVKKVQEQLNDLGYECGTPDGAAGKKTAAAITQFQTDNGLEVTGVIDDALIAALDGSEAPDGTNGDTEPSDGANGEPDEPEEERVEATIDKEEGDFVMVPDELAQFMPTYLNDLINVEQMAVICDGISAQGIFADLLEDGRCEFDGMGGNWTEGYLEVYQATAKNQGTTKLDVKMTRSGDNYVAVLSEPVPDGYEGYQLHLEEHWGNSVLSFISRAEGKDSYDAYMELDTEVYGYIEITVYYNYSLYSNHGKNKMKTPHSIAILGIYSYPSLDMNWFGYYDESGRLVRIDCEAEEDDGAIGIVGSRYYKYDAE